MAKKKTKDLSSISIEDKLNALFDLQSIDIQLDKIRILRGELPLEVQDLEDGIEGLETRILNFEDDIKQNSRHIAEKKNEIQVSETMMTKYKEQQEKVRNNREYDSLSKEIEFQGLEIELSEKKIREFNAKAKNLEAEILNSKEILADQQLALKNKTDELDEIIGENKKEEEVFLKKRDTVEKKIEDRLSIAYNKIRENARNGLAVVHVERGACGGCFNKIPPQRQMDIKQRKKIIVCEYCGRILVDVAEEEIKETPKRTKRVAKKKAK